MITTKMPKIIQSTLDCYSGSCQNCHPPTWNCLSWRQAKQLVEKVTLYAGDIRMITTKMPKIIQATLDCYSGSCQNCHPPTWNCLSWRQAKQLVERSQHLKACGLTLLNMADEDRATLKGLIEMRLGNSALQMTRHRLTTDKNESINRSFSASLPKNVKFSRNAHGRVSSVIDRINYGVGNSMLRKLENVHCPITRGGQVARAVKQIQHEVEYQRQYKR